MKHLTVVILSMLIGLVAFGFGVLYFINAQPGVAEMNVELRKIKLQTELQQLKNAGQKDVIAYNLERAKLIQEQSVLSAEPVRKSRIIGLSLKHLWPLWSLLAGASTAILYAYSRRQATIQEVAKAEQAALMLTEEHTARVVERILPAYAKALSQRKEPVFVPELIEPAALRAFTGHVHFSQAALDADFEPDSVMMGRNVETGGLCQIPLEELQSLTVNGLQKQGKSVLLLSVIHAALMAKHERKEDVAICLIDIHAGLRDSLLTRLNAFVPGAASLFDRVFDNEDTINNDLPGYFDTLITQGKNRDGNGITLIVFDEYTESVANLERGKEIESRVKRLFNYRKAGIFLALAMFEGGKNSQSAKGLNVSKMSVSKALFRTAKDEGARFLAGGAEAAGLEKGEYLLLLPGMAEPERIKAPMFAAQDFARFQRHVNVDAVDKALTSPLTPETTGVVGVDACPRIPGIIAEMNEFRTRQQWSLGELSRQIGIDKGQLSKLINGKISPSPRVIDTVETFLRGAQKSNVVAFRK